MDVSACVCVRVFVLHTKKSWSYCALFVCALHAYDSRPTVERLKWSQQTGHTVNKLTSAGVMSSSISARDVFAYGRKSADKDEVLFDASVFRNAVLKGHRHILVLRFWCANRGCVLQSFTCRRSVWERLVRPAAGDPPHHLLAAGLGWNGDQPRLVPRSVPHAQGVSTFIHRPALIFRRYTFYHFPLYLSMLQLRLLRFGQVSQWCRVISILSACDCVCIMQTRSYLKLVTARLIGPCMCHSGI